MAAEKARPTDTRARRKRGVMVLVGLLGLAVAGALFWHNWGGGRHPAPPSSTLAGYLGGASGTAVSNPPAGFPGSEQDFINILLSPTGAVVTGGTNGPLTDEERVNLMVNRGIQVMDKGQPASAVKLFQAAVKIAPGDETIHYNLGIAHGRMGEFGEARKAYLEALRLFPEYTDAHVNLGNLLARQGELTQAVAHFNLALKAEPERASAHNALGTVLARQGRTAEAIAHFQEALRVQTNFVEARFNLGNLLVAQGDLKRAIEEFRTVLGQQPEFQPAQAALERALRKQTPGAQPK